MKQFKINRFEVLYFKTGLGSPLNDGVFALFFTLISPIQVLQHSLIIQFQVIKNLDSDPKSLFKLFSPRNLTCKNKFYPVNCTSTFV